MKTMSRFVALLSVGAIMCFAPAAMADDLSVATLEYGSWPAAVANFQTQMATEGSVTE